MDGKVRTSDPFFQLAGRVGDTFRTEPSLELHLGPRSIPCVACFPRPGIGSRRRTIISPSSLNHCVCRASDPSPGTGPSRRSVHNLGESYPAGSDFSSGTLWNSTGLAAPAAPGRTGSSGLVSQLGTSSARGSRTDHRIASFDRLHDRYAGSVGAFVRAATRIYG